MVEPAPPGEVGRWTVPWSIGTALSALLVSFFCFVVGSSAVVEFAGRHPSIEWEIAGYQSLTLGVLLSAALLVLGRFHPPLSVLGYRFPGWSTLAAAAASVILITLGAYIVQQIFNAVFPGYNVHGNVRELGNTIQGHPGTAEKVLILIWASVEVPLTEETLFRGIVFQGLRSFFDRWIPYQLAVFLAAVISGCLFGLAHGEPHTLPILIFVGMALAYLFQFGRSIYASAVVHGIINLLAMVTLLQKV
jgi:membrane protease YdiL (CAAX protease family)